MNSNLTKEDYLKAAEIVANAKAQSLDYVIQILSYIIPLKVMIKVTNTMPASEIKRLVKMDKRSVDEIAKEVGVADSTVRRWMRGDRTPSREMLNKLLAVLDLVDLKVEGEDDE